jgi:hypothetical protein
MVVVGVDRLGELMDVLGPSGLGLRADDDHDQNQATQRRRME